MTIRIQVVLKCKKLIVTSSLTQDLSNNKCRTKNHVPKPKKASTKEIQQAFADADINLMALFSGDDPFAPIAGAKKDPF